MKQEIAKLKEEFIKIQKMEYIKAVNNYSSGGGLTLEKLLNATAGNLCYPDLNGIELKTINQYWKKNINLFCDTPLCNYNKYESSMKLLTKRYGYPNKKHQKVFNGKINSTLWFNTTRKIATHLAKSSQKTRFLKICPKSLMFIINVFTY